MIERYQLRYFLAVLDTGTFSKAALACNISQPTLSVGIAKLEKSLGQQLFRRSSRRVELTEAGVRLTAHARTIEATFSQAEQAASAAAASHVVRLGVLTTIPSAWLETFAALRRASAGAIDVELVEGRERELQEKLARGRIDIALSTLEASDAATPLLTEGYSLALPASHRMADRQSIRAEDLAGEPMIVRRHCEALGDTSRHFTSRGIRPFFPARTTSDERALALVRAGVGITVMPDCFAAPGVVRVRLEDFTPTRRLGLSSAPLLDHAGPDRRAAVRDVAQSASLCALVTEMPPA